jgi:hypothetical protein
LVFGYGGLIKILGAATICWPIWHCQNGIVFLMEKHQFCFVGYSLGYPLAPLLTCASKAYIIGFSLITLSAIRVGDQGVFFLVTM